MFNSFFNALINIRQTSEKSAGQRTVSSNDAVVRLESNRDDLATNDSPQPFNVSPRLPVAELRVELPLPDLGGRFASIATFRTFVNSYCRTSNPGYALVTTRSRKWTAIFQCSRHGFSMSRREKHNLKCGCLFRIEGNFNTDAFDFKVVVPYHNHDAISSIREISYLRSPKVNEIENCHQELATTILISPTNVAKMAIQSATGCDVVTSKDVANIRKSLRLRALQRR